MGKQKDRYRRWGEAEMNAWLLGDVEASVDCFSEDCTRVSVNPFGNHKIIQGREALREAYGDKASYWYNRKLISFEVLSANKERGILHSWKSWTNKEGQDMACNYISIIKLDRNDRCTDYSEWNVVKAKEEEAD